MRPSRSRRRGNSLSGFFGGGKESVGRVGDCAPFLEEWRKIVFGGKNELIFARCQLDGLFLCERSFLRLMAHKNDPSHHLLSKKNRRRTLFLLLFQRAHSLLKRNTHNVIVTSSIRRPCRKHGRLLQAFALPAHGRHVVRRRRLGFKRFCLR